jgi:predicted GIY-YIG superfamily endonuclease
MMSRTAKAREVRAYFIAVERTLFKYRDEIVHGMDNRIKVLEINQKQKLEAKDFIGGVIYVIKASLDMDSVYKIGRTKDLSKRLASHSSASADSLEIVYKFKTSCVNKVESCLKLMIKEKQYRKYKEVYQIDIASLKKVISSCDDACIEVVQTPKANKKHQIGGGQYYAVLISN